jgi:hypothetical protein
MVLETLIICVTIFILFLPLVSAKAEEIRERARKLELENSQAEFNEL